MSTEGRSEIRRVYRPRAMGRRNEEEGGDAGENETSIAPSSSDRILVFCQGKMIFLFILLVSIRVNFQDSN